MVSTQLFLNPLVGMGRDGHLTAKERKSKRLRTASTFNTLSVVFEQQHDGKGQALCRTVYLVGNGSSAK